MAGLCLLLAWLVPGPALAQIPFDGLALIRPNPVRLAPTFSVPGPDGRAVTLADARGRVVLLNFWATWCAPCREEMPAMDRLFRRFRGEGLTVLAISVDGDGARAVAPFVSQQRLSYPIGLDPTMTVATRYGVRALPSSFLLDRTGRLVALALGPREWDSEAAHAVIAALLRHARRGPE
jgi:peroxiredoxin